MSKKVNGEKSLNKLTTDPWGVSSQWQICSVPDTVVSYRLPGQRSVKPCLGKWQSPLPWCFAMFTDTWSSPYTGRKNKEGVAENRNKGGWTIWTRKGVERGRQSNGRDGSYCDNAKMERDRGRLGGGWLVLLLFNRLAVFAWLGPGPPVPADSP